MFNLFREERRVKQSRFYKALELECQEKVEAAKAINRTYANRYWQLLGGLSKGISDKPLIIIHSWRTIPPGADEHWMYFIDEDGSKLCSEEWPIQSSALNDLFEKYNEHFFDQDGRFRPLDIVTTQRPTLVGRGVTGTLYTV